MAEEDDDEKIDDKKPVSVVDVDQDELEGKWVRRRGGQRYRFAGYTSDTFGLGDAQCVVLYDGASSTSRNPSFRDDFIVVSRSRFEADFTYQKNGDGNGGGGSSWF